MAQVSNKKKGCGLECANCGATNELESVCLKSCGRCGLVVYCSTRCQHQHWAAAGGGHKRNCVPKTSEARKPNCCGEGGGGEEGAGKGAGDVAEGDSCCPVCLEPLSPSSSAVVVATLPCGHVLRAACVEGLRSFGVNQACPVCRAELPPGSETLYEEAGRRYFIFLRRHQRKKALSATDQDEMKEVLRLARTAADLGGDRSCGQAKMLLGLIYLEGRGVAQNDAKALEWYRKAAEQGLAEAQFITATLLFEGKNGLSPNTDEAASWFQKAADQGHERGQLNTAVILYDRLDVEGAVQWFESAAAQGNVEAQFRLGDIYSQGRGPVKVNKALAKSFYELAANKDHAGAQRSLAILHHTGQGTPQSHAEAARWYQKAARRDAVAARGLGLLFASGCGVPKSDVEAVRCWRMAAEKGDAKAQHFLGLAIWNGKGVSRRNPTEAAKWLREAAAQGKLESIEALVRLGLTQSK